MPGFLRTAWDDSDDRGPVTLNLRGVRHCEQCPHGVPCAGHCSRRLCKAHAYGCSGPTPDCQLPMCEACWTRHEVRGLHVAASRTEVETATAVRAGHPLNRAPARERK